MNSETLRFLDVRNHGFFRVAVAKPRVHLARPSKNLEEIENIIDTIANREQAQYILFPELCITGYSCNNLFFSQSLLSEALSCLDALIDYSGGYESMFTVGMPLIVDDRIANCAVTLCGGKIIAVTPKTYLAEGEEFIEQAYFSPASDFISREINLCGQNAPFGNDIIITHPVFENVRLHVSICEDDWVSCPVSCFASLQGATLLANLSASNITLGKSEYRLDLMKASSARNLAITMYASAGFGESSDDMAWDGQGIICERGVELKQSGRFGMYSGYIVGDVSPDLIVQERIKSGSFAHNRRLLADVMSFRRVSLPRESRTSFDDLTPFLKFHRTIDPRPFVPSDPFQRTRHCNEVFNMQATSLARRLLALPPQMRRVIIGVSGGRDSTLAVLVACKALDLLGLPRENFVGVTMPGFGTSSGTYEDACSLIKALGGTFYDISIRELSLLMFQNIGHNPAEENVTFENVQAWARQNTLFALCSQLKGIVVGTGTLSELAIGWCTMYGDHASHYNVNASVAKTLVNYLIEWVSETVYASEDNSSKEISEILISILSREMSPELLPLSPDGKIAQRSEEINGPYFLQDFFTYWQQRFALSPSVILRLAYEAFGSELEYSQIRKFLMHYLEKFFSSQFKRSVAPNGPKVGSVCFTPRSVWRMPADLEYVAKVNGLDTSHPWHSDIQVTPESLE